PTRGGGWRLPLSAPAPIRNERGQGHDGSRRTLRESAGESVSIRAIERAVEHQVSIAITPERIEPEAATVAPGEVALVTSNQAGAPILLQVERAEWPDTIVTAATVSTVQEFRDLFSSEALAPGLLLSIQRLTFVFTDLTGSTALYQRLSQARAFRLVQEHFVILGAAIAANRGAIVKTIGDAVMAVFPTARDAVAAACAMQRDIRKLDTAGLADPTRVLKIGIHEGPSLVANQVGKLDYFGTTVNIASRVEHVATGGEIVATGAVCDQPDVGALIERERLSAKAGEVPLRGIVEPVQIRRLRVP
ncbi:MAG: adenylate/guanylate cyclase domain-containing protein, partial [Chloroflexi bacterium]|nr:adenylate/guanylate cyclase domain-containing protein [Chloroflexota bacterium]